MIFLMNYDRRAGQIVDLRTFADAEMDAASEARLALELELMHAGIEREVVILQAPSESALRQTHRRYFETPESLGQSLIDSLS